MNDNLYQEAILGHARSELRAGRLADPDATATADNPLCGDRVTFDVRIAAGRIADIAHHTPRVRAVQGRGGDPCGASRWYHRRRGGGRRGRTQGHA